ncbi:MAG: HEAT repeat domain-containing protein [Myxococcota bacterium]
MSHNTPSSWGEWALQCLNAHTVLPEPEGAPVEQLRGVFAGELNRLESASRQWSWSDAGLLKLVRWLDAKDAYLVFRLKPSAIVRDMDLVDAVASRGEAALEGLEQELTSIPVEWHDVESVSMHGGNRSECFGVYTNLCLSLFESYRRLERAPSDRVRPILEKYISSITRYAHHYQQFLWRVREMSTAVLGEARVAELTRPDEGPINWSTIGFVPDEERARRAVDALFDPGFWEYKDWNDLERTYTVGEGIRNYAAFSLLGEYAVPAIEPYIGQGKAKQRAGLMCALGFTGSDLAIEPLTRGVSDSSARVRAVAGECLLRFEHDKVREALEPLTRSKRSPVRKAASELMGRLR